MLAAVAISASQLLVNQPIAEASYDNISVTTVAQVKTDASLQVTERRAFSFDEAYSAMEWHISGAGNKDRINVSSVRALLVNDKGKATGKWSKFKEVAFSPSWRTLLEETGGTTQAMEQYFEEPGKDDADDFSTRPKARTYSLDTTNDDLYIFPRAVEKNTAYECNYTINNAATVYDDVAELYWTYTMPEGDEEAKDIHVRIKLPVPKNAEVLPNENVFAWGHGPDGSIDIREDGSIDITVPSVKAGQYSMAHIVFPRSWLSHVNMKSESYKTGTRLGYALEEEDGWTDTHSAYLVNSYALGIGLCSMCLIALVACVIIYLLYGRERRPDAALPANLAAKEGSPPDEDADAGALAKEGAGGDRIPVAGAGSSPYADNDGEDVMSRDLSALCKEGAVCGRLMRWNRHSAYDLAYVISELSQKGVIRITGSEDVGKTRFRLTPSSKNVNLDEVEQGALYLLFEIIGEGYQSISLEDIERYCEDNPSLAVSGMTRWQNAVTRQVEEAGVFDVRSRRAQKAVICIAAIIAIIGVISAVMGMGIGAFMLAIVTAIMCAAIAYSMPRRTEKGILLASRLEKDGSLDSCNRGAWEVPFAKAFGEALSA